MEFDWGGKTRAPNCGVGPGTIGGVREILISTHCLAPKSFGERPEMLSRNGKEAVQQEHGHGTPATNHRVSTEVGNSGTQWPSTRWAMLQREYDFAFTSDRMRRHTLSTTRPTRWMPLCAAGGGQRSWRVCVWTTVKSPVLCGAVVCGVVRHVVGATWCGAVPCAVVRCASQNDSILILHTPQRSAL